MNNVLQYIINLIVFVPIVIVLIVASIKLSKANFSNIGNNKYTKVLERTNLSKDTDVFVLKIGDEGCVLVSSPSKVEKIKELSKEDIENIEDLKQESKVDISNLRKVRLKKTDTNNLNTGNLNLNEFKLNKLNLKGKRYGRLR
ncbi:flagellar biosynthetic protein FliO [Romboutsia lituseburensis]|uniref:flagellar biosynthetic protein FliO n=1 Tax=Romboutsia lituseburensis TaxID=1537 RepID=UPI00215A15B2|nr:flagellar biosynthetic protein FliO [Romboutsia lituseburensis]MCR8746729.1 flagellar biosynthetic protein FliO [Romboutsia lituseburensis]